MYSEKSVNEIDLLCSIYCLFFEVLQTNDSFIIIAKNTLMTFLTFELQDHLVFIN